MSLPNTTHPNSKKITIHRKPGVTQAQSDLQEYYASCYMSLGSYFTGGGSQRSATGLQFWEEDLVMPYLLDVPKDDKEFRKKVAIFAEDLCTKIPYKEGATLEIGLLEDNTKPITAGNMPIAPIDYIRWRHALGHPECAHSLDEAQGNMLVMYYIHDASRESNTAYIGLEQKDDALTAYLSLKGDSHKVEMHLSLLGIDPRPFSEKDRVSELRKTVENKATEFLENVADKDAEERYFINQLLGGSILSLIGTSYLIKESGENIGYSLQEAVEFLKNKANSQIKSILKAQLQEVRKPSKKKVTTEVA